MEAGLKLTILCLSTSYVPRLKTHFTVLVCVLVTWWGSIVSFAKIWGNVFNVCVILVSPLSKVPVLSA